MAQKLDVKRGRGNKWDDGSNHDEVAKIYVRGGHKGIHYIYFDYVKSGQPKDRSIHGSLGKGFTQTFEINYLRNEHLESVDVYYDESEFGSIQALLFKTNFRASEIMGYDNGTKYTLAVDRKKIIGFHGTSASGLTSLGAYFTPIFTHTRHEARGGKGGKAWDDGSDHEGVSNIRVRGGLEGIQFIEFNYVKDKDGQHKNGSIHGLSGEGFSMEFEINYLDKEYLVTVEGYYDDVSQVIQGLQFKTNIKTFEFIGYRKGKKFSLGANGMKIIGFHGYSEKNLNSLGAYFTTLPPPKLECKGPSGGDTGSHWDDGAFDGVKKVYVTFDLNVIMGIRFDYAKGGKTEKRVHGIGMDDQLIGKDKEFVVDYPNEFITSVEGTFEGYENRVQHPDRRITSLIFKTSKEKTSKIFGAVDGKKPVKFVLERKDCALVGFHGWFSNQNLSTLGAYIFPLPPPPSDSYVDKLEAQGGDGGVSWDDGANFDGVKKIYIGNCEIGVAFVKFLYDKETEVVVGEDHGRKTLNEVKEFELEYPSEYLISVEGRYDKIDGIESKVLVMLKFKTNKRTSQAFGLDMVSNFVLHKEGHKIVGFHGKANNMLHQIGVHVLPITN